MLPPVGRGMQGKAEKTPGDARLSGSEAGGAARRAQVKRSSEPTWPSPLLRLRVTTRRLSSENPTWSKRSETFICALSAMAASKAALADDMYARTRKLPGGTWENRTLPRLDVGARWYRVRRCSREPRGSRSRPPVKSIGVNSWRIDLIGCRNRPDIPVPAGRASGSGGARRHARLANPGQPVGTIGPRAACPPAPRSPGAANRATPSRSFPVCSRIARASDAWVVPSPVRRHSRPVRCRGERGFFPAVDRKVASLQAGHGASV